MKGKKCPFCGNKATLKGGPILSGNRNLYWIHCTKCGISQLGYSTKEEALIAWNTRATEKE